MRDLSRAYYRHIVLAGKEQAFWILVAFLATFVVIRAITHSIRAGRGPFRALRVGETHVHHLVPGILLLIVTGYLSNALHPRQARTTVAVFFGIGAALTLDEFALWLHLSDVYWSRHGRRSIDVVIAAAAIATLVVLGLDFWGDAAHALIRHV